MEFQILKPKLQEEGGDALSDSPNVIWWRFIKINQIPLISSFPMKWSFPSLLHLYSPPICLAEWKANLRSESLSHSLTPLTHTHTQTQLHILILQFRPCEILRGYLVVTFLRSVRVRSFDCICFWLKPWLYFWLTVLNEKNDNFTLLFYLCQLKYIFLYANLTLTNIIK